MNNIKILIKENRKIIKEGSTIDPDSLRALMDEVLAPDIDKKILINIEKESFSIVRTDMSGRNLTWEPNGDISINSNLDRNYLDFNADLDVGGFENKKKNPAFSRWLEQGQEVTKEVEKLVDLEYTKLSQPEYRRAVGDFRGNMQVILGMIKDTIVKGWKKIKVLFPRNWTNLRNRLYLKSMKYSPPKPAGVASIGELPKKQEPHLDVTDGAQKDLKQARDVKANSQKKVDKLEGQRVKRKMKGKPPSPRLEAKIKKFKERVAAAQTLEEAIERAMKSADVGDVAKSGAKKSGKFLSKLTGPLGWAVTGLAFSSLFGECEALGATKREAGSIAALDETLGGSFLVEPLKDWLSERKKDAFLRYELARGRVGAKTKIGPFTSEHMAIIRRVSKYQQGKIGYKKPSVRKAYDDLGRGMEKQMQDPVFGDMLESIDKNFQRSNKIKIKINS